MTRWPAFVTPAVRRQLAAGDVLCAEGDEDTDVFQVLSGRVTIERSASDGMVTVAQLGEGEIVGEVTSALGTRRLATVRAIEPTTVLAYTQEQFARWLDDHSEAAGIIASEARLRSNRSRASSVLSKLFGLENQDVVTALVEEISWVNLAAGDVLFEQGDESDSAHLVLSGRLRVVAQDADATTTLDVELGRGEIVGEMGILEDAPRSATVRAMRETTLAMITRETFNSIIVQYPSLAGRVFLTIIDRLAHRREPDDRARVVTVASTIQSSGDTATERDRVDVVAAAIEPYGSTLHLSSSNLSRFVRDVAGVGAHRRVAEFLHEADVAHDYVVLEADTEMNDWSVRVARQSDRFVLFCSAEPDSAEIERMRHHLDLLSDEQRAVAWIVRVHPTSATRPRRSARFLTDFAVAEVHNIRDGEPKHLGRIGRLATGNGRGVVLGGGGAKGFAHIGALRALAEAEVDYDRIGGASIGAIIGAGAALDLSPAVLLAVMTERFHQDLLDYTIPLVSLVKAERIAEGLNLQFGGWDITDLWIPFFCVTTNLTTSTLDVHRTGDVARATRASAAIPVALPPVPIDGDLHVDGGVLDNVPVAAMHADPSIGTVIAVDVSPPGGPSAANDFGMSVSGFDVFKQRVLRRPDRGLPDIGTTLMSSMLIGSTRARNKSTDDDVVDLYIDLDLSGVGLLQFENHAEVAERGYVGAREAIEQWQTLAADADSESDDGR